MDGCASIHKDPKLFAVMVLCPSVPRDLGFSGLGLLIQRENALVLAHILALLVICSQKTLSSGGLFLFSSLHHPTSSMFVSNSD